MGIAPAQSLLAHDPAPGVSEDPRRGAVVEVAPAYDPSGITAEAALRVCLEFLSGTAWQRREAAVAAEPR